MDYAMTLEIRMLDPTQIALIHPMTYGVEKAAMPEVKVNIADSVDLDDSRHVTTVGNKTHIISPIDIS